MTLRILVTGSRDWDDKSAIARAFMAAVHAYGRHLIDGDENGPRMAWDQVTVVHGAARGADTLAGRLAAAWGMRVEAHPVTADDWHAPCRSECQPNHRRIGRGGKDYCPAAGNYRNQRMVDLGADVCLAFPLGVSRGTRECRARADAAGIPVHCYEPAAVTV